MERQSYRYILWASDIFELESALYQGDVGRVPALAKPDDPGLLLYPCGSFVSHVHFF